MTDQHPWHDAPRVQLGHWPTPLEPLDRLTRELGGPRIWVKRDDCSGLATGGNKTRKLETLLGQGIQDGIDTVVTFGAVQSNHARQTAAACAKLGLTCHVVLSRRVAPPGADRETYESGGNVQLDRLLGAEVHIRDTDEVPGFTKSLLENLETEGRNVLSIPPGGSNATGALGYAVCAEELVSQCSNFGISPGYIVHASASSGTQAGLLYGYSHLDPSQKVMGVNVFHPDPGDLIDRVESLLTRMCEKFGTPARRAEVTVNHSYFGEAYGTPTQETLNAIRLTARLEGLLFDPVYSGKALTGLIDQVALGNFDDTDNVILIHTGGSASIPVYTAL